MHTPGCRIILRVSVITHFTQVGYLPPLYPGSTAHDSELLRGVSYICFPSILSVRVGIPVPTVTSHDVIGIYALLAEQFYCSIIY